MEKFIEVYYSDRLRPTKMHDWLSCIGSILYSYLKAKQNQIMTKKRPCSLRSGADSDIMLAITYKTDKQETWILHVSKNGGTKEFLFYSIFLVQVCFADLLQHGHVSDCPALEGGAGVTLDLYEFVLLCLWGLNVGHLHKERRVPTFKITFIFITINSLISNVILVNFLFVLIKMMGLKTFRKNELLLTSERFIETLFFKLKILLLFPLLSFQISNSLDQDICVTFALIFKHMDLIWSSNNKKQMQLLLSK